MVPFLRTVIHKGTGNEVQCIGGDVVLSSS